MAGRKGSEWVSEEKDLGNTNTHTHLMGMVMMIIGEEEGETRRIF